MPVFIAGESKTARVEMRNTTNRILACSGELYLVKDTTKVASSGPKFFSVAAGASRIVEFPIRMPTAAGTYPVYIDVYDTYTNVLLVVYRVVEDVVITGVGYSSIYLTVTDIMTDQLIEGAEVYLDTVKHLTDKNGRTYYTYLTTPGTYIVRCLKAGYREYTKTLTFREPGTYAFYPAMMPLEYVGALTINQIWCEPYTANTYIKDTKRYFNTTIYIRATNNKATPLTLDVNGNYEGPMERPNRIKGGWLRTSVTFQPGSNTVSAEIPEAGREYMKDYPTDGTFRLYNVYIAKRAPKWGETIEDVALSNIISLDNAFVVPA